MQYLRRMLAGCFLLLQLTASAQMPDSIQVQIDSINQSFQFQTGTITMAAGNARLQVPEGFRYLDQVQSRRVLEELWGNPEDSTVLGMLVPEQAGAVGPGAWGYTISFDPMGYVADDDAKEINYDDLLTDQQKEAAEINEQRVNAGFEAVELIGWAAKPYYDESRKTLHWAKELQFGEDSAHTLNYNLRILGRKGIFLLNAVADLEQLPSVQQSTENVLASITFDKGFQYADYQPGVDNVAAWTLGG